MIRRPDKKRGDDMMYGLDMNQLPTYCYSDFKQFVKNEKHVTRICPEDVLIIMLDGTLYLNEADQPVQVTKGHYYIQKRGLYQEGVIPSSDARYYYIHFLGHYDNTPKSLPLSGNAYFTESFDGFEKLNFLQNTDASQVEKLAEFYRILVKLKSGDGISRNQRTVLQVISLITENYQKIYSLEELALITGCSKNYLIRIFKEETGQTPFTYITNLRLNAAKNLLANSDMSINEISDKCGFGSYINFYKSFTKQLCTTPELWRKKNRGLISE